MSSTTGSAPGPPGPRPADVREERRDPPRSPRVLMHLPDGQHLEVSLVSWHQYRDGSWRARVRWSTWGAFRQDGDVHTRACTQEGFVPAEMLRPVDDGHGLAADRPRLALPRQG